MANTYVRTAFKIPVTTEEAELLEECFEVAAEIDCCIRGEELDEARAYYDERSAGFRAAFPIHPDESDPFAAFLDLWDDPDFPQFDADLSIGAADDSPGAVALISGHQIDVRAVANLIQKACPSALPFGFQWAYYCDRLAPNEHGGGYFVITGTDIIGGSTGWLMNEVLQSLEAKRP
ncbi:MAG: hypothetical protein J7498_01285 [Sphingobium sp.]|nr:hypothetical protein [Sphingobium sp.]